MDKNNLKTILDLASTILDLHAPVCKILAVDCTSHALGFSDAKIAAAQVLVEFVEREEAKGE